MLRKKTLPLILLLTTPLLAELSDTVTSQTSVQIDDNNDFTTSQSTNKYNNKKNTSTDDSTGVIKQKFDASNPSEIYNTMNNNKNAIISQGKNTVQKFKFDLTNKGNFYDNPNFAKKEYLTKYLDKNSSTTKALNFVYNFQHSVAVNQIKKTNTVKCYITRKLNNAYYCPLPNKDSSYYVGGSAKDSKDKALETCNNDCKNKLNILKKETNKPLTVKENFNKTIHKGTTFTIKLDDEMKVKDLNLLLSVKQQDKYEIEFSSNISKETLPNKYFFNADISSNDSSFGIKFNYQDTNNYSEIFWKDKTLYLYKKVNGTLLKLNSTQIDKTFKKNIYYNIKLKLTSTFINFYIDDVLYMNSSFISNNASLKVALNQNEKVKNSYYTNSLEDTYVSYILYDENNEKINEGTINIEDILSLNQIFPNTLPQKYYKLYFYQPYKKSITYNQDTKQETITKLANDFLTLKWVRVNYVDNSYYYCPNQFVENKDECLGGTIVNVFINGNIYNVCSTKMPGKAKDYAYFTAEYAQSQCYETMQCKPTYRHLLGDNSNKTLPSYAYDVEIGCVDSEDNKLCTKAICQQLLNDKSKFPTAEKVWEKDDYAINTIVNSTPSVNRPVVDLQAELSGKNRNITFQEEMKDIAYKNMIKDGSYTMSKYNIGTNIPYRSYMQTYRNSDNVLNFVWNIKGNSFDYDNNKKYYFYSVIQINHNYSNQILQFQDKQGNYKSAKDLGVIDMDSVFLIKDGKNSYKPIKRIEDFRRRVPHYSDEGNITGYSWVTPNDKKEETVMYGGNNNWLSYSSNDKAPYFTSQKFSSNHITNRIPLINDFYSSVADLEGVLIKSQSTKHYTLIKNYNGGIDESTKSHISSYKIYGFYSAKDNLTYQEVFTNLTDRNLIYDSANPKKYTIVMNDDSLYQNSKVRTFIYGTPNHFSAVGNFTPDSSEEGHKTFIFMFLYDNASK